jgi:hypothetical protein
MLAASIFVLRPKCNSILKINGNQQTGVIAHGPPGLDTYLV